MRGEAATASEATANGCGVKEINNCFLYNNTLCLSLFLTQLTSVVLLPPRSVSLFSSLS